ncbi:unnamed protein product [Ranitomeya imitator]|uniref:Uncharacterized protein n=1 Tax=Ranitomeya imitator TaxID=111125 RepID=A0ABN9MJZ6_9NEOB|nr:unnamed protein product [Ranitomeya imitator]
MALIKGLLKTKFHHRLRYILEVVSTSLSGPANIGYSDSSGPSFCSSLQPADTFDLKSRISRFVVQAPKDLPLLKEEALEIKH